MEQSRLRSSKFHVTSPDFSRCHSDIAKAGGEGTRFPANVCLQAYEKAMDMGVIRRFQTVLRGWFLVPEVFFSESTFCRPLRVLPELTLDLYLLILLYYGNSERNSAQKDQRKSAKPKCRAQPIVIRNAHPFLFSVIPCHAQIALIGGPTALFEIEDLTEISGF